MTQRHLPSDVWWEEEVSGMVKGGDTSRDEWRSRGGNHSYSEPGGERSQF